MIVPPIISPYEALDRVLPHAAEWLNMVAGAAWVPGSVEWRIAVQDEAKRVLQRACVFRQLTPVVEDHNNGNLRALRSDYFERPGSQTFFHRYEFQIWDLDAWTAEGEDYDPLFRTLRKYNGWPTGFFEPEFNAWREATLEAPNVDANAPGKALADDAGIEAALAELPTSAEVETAIATTVAGLATKADFTEIARDVDIAGLQQLVQQAIEPLDLRAEIDRDRAETRGLDETRRRVEAE